MEDKLIFIASIILCTSLIPQIYYSLINKIVEITYYTIISTCIGLILMSIVLYRLEFMFSFSIIAFTLLCWWILFLLKIVFYKKRRCYESD